MVRQSFDELVEENAELKQEAADLQMQGIKLKNRVERQDREMATIKQRVS